jgi:hypothetical protein
MEAAQSPCRTHCSSMAPRSNPNLLHRVSKPEYCSGSWRNRTRSMISRDRPGGESTPQPLREPLHDAGPGLVQDITVSGQIGEASLRGTGEGNGGRAGELGVPNRMNVIFQQPVNK